MPTRRGILLALTGLSVWVVGRIFGSQAAEQIGFALIALVAAGIAVVRLRGRIPKIARRITPDRGRVHAPITVTLKIHNDSRGTTPLLLLEDHIPTGLASRARLVVPGIEPDGHREVALEVRPEQRGRYEIGPLEAEVSDPFGLARARSRALGTSSFLVHPRVERLVLPRDFGERRTVARATIRQPTGPRGEDFYTIREYAEGDDLRKVHWASTAKRGKVMIRHEETPWHTRATIVLDDRRSSYGDISQQMSFERAVSATASLTDLYARAGYSYRLAGAHHPGVPSGKGSQQQRMCLDLLATIQSRGHHHESDPMLLARLAELEARRSAEATLILVAGSLESEVGVALARLHRSFRQMLVVCFPAHRYGTAGTRTRWEAEKNMFEVASIVGRSGGRVLILGPGDRFAPAWAALSTRSKAGDMTWDLKPELV
jgi:uncharacterized protein (DUF58 family)